ncbi:MAG: DHH family phosphoesterase [Deltaproteobacteria bacterium]|nr:DHH family phosphoesterase [Deltaproteobacteria bacterium]
MKLERRPSTPSPTQPVELRAATPARLPTRPTSDSFELKPNQANALTTSPLFGPLPDRTLPPLSVALESDAITPLPLSKLPVPSDVVSALNAAKNVLVVGHVFPDGDAIGSAVGLARALKAAGKKAVPCVDDTLIGGKFRSIADPGELKTAADLAGQKFDTVVIVDVAESNRIGGAAAFLKTAERVVVLDHHQVAATHEGLGLPSKTPLIPWVERRADAAAFLVAAVASRIVPESDGAWHHVAPPLLAAMLTDTLGFSQNGVAGGSLRVFKHVLTTHADGDLETIERRLSYELPKEAQAVLDGRFDAVPKASRPRARSLRAQRGFAVPAGAAAVISIPKGLHTLALEVARRSDPGANENDIKGALIERLEKVARRGKLAALIMEGDEGSFVSLRSTEQGLALELAQALGGGGHANKAAARPSGSLDEVEAKVTKWISNWDEAERLRLRVGHF